MSLKQREVLHVLVASCPSQLLPYSSTSTTTPANTVRPASRTARRPRAGMSANASQQMPLGTCKWTTAHCGRAEAATVL